MTFYCCIHKDGIVCGEDCTPLAPEPAPEPASAECRACGDLAPEPGHVCPRPAGGQLIRAVPVKATARVTPADLDAAEAMVSDAEGVAERLRSMRERLDIARAIGATTDVQLPVPSVLLVSDQCTNRPASPDPRDARIAELEAQLAKANRCNVCDADPGPEPASAGLVEVQRFPWKLLCQCGAVTTGTDTEAPTRCLGCGKQASVEEEAKDGSLGRRTRGRSRRAEGGDVTRIAIAIGASGKTCTGCEQVCVGGDGSFFCATFGAPLRMGPSAPMLRDWVPQRLQACIDAELHDTEDT